MPREKVRVIDPEQDRWQADMKSVRDVAINEIAKRWGINDSELVPQDNGFDWLPGSHAVHVRIFGDQRKIAPTERFRISIMTD